MTKVVVATIGDVYVVRTGGLGARLIRFGACILDKPNMYNHVAIMHHYTDGVPWGIEGRPGGVGYVDIRGYLNSPWTINNAEQPKTHEQRIEIAARSEAMLGTKYDWQAIAADAFQDLGIRDLFAQNWEEQGVPGHVVCSSYAAYIYSSLGMSHPTSSSDRLTTPQDWAEFIITKAW